MHGPEKPGDIPKIRKLAALKQYEFLNGIPPGFSPAERFFRQWPGVTGATGVGVDCTKVHNLARHPLFY